MGAVDKNGIYIYDASDTVNTWEGFMNLGQNSVSNVIGDLRLGAVYKAATSAEANTVRDRLVASGLTPSAANPILIYITTIGKFMAWDGQGWRLNGDAVQSWNWSGDVPLTPGKPVSGAILFGKQGPSDKFIMEHGSAVVRVQQARGGGSGRHAYLPLKNRYQGVSTAIFTNGDAEAFGRVFSPDDNNWLTNHSADHIRILAPGAAIGSLLRVNYIVLGWKE